MLAEVAGTEDYRTVLAGRGKAIGGECSCPAFGDGGFCKHMVATALAANAAGGDAEAEGIGVLARIRDHLKKKGIDALVEMIVEMAERDPALFRRLDLAAVAVHADDKTLEARLRKAIDTATRTQGYVEYRAAAGWAEGVSSALDAVADLASGPRAGLAMELAERAIDRIVQAIEEIDDSDGLCGALLGEARDVHLAAAAAAQPDPIALANDLFAREMEEDYDTFYREAALSPRARRERARRISPPRQCGLGEAALARRSRAAGVFERTSPAGDHPRFLRRARRRCGDAHCSALQGSLLA